MMRCCSKLSLLSVTMMVYMLQGCGTGGGSGITPEDLQLIDPDDTAPVAKADSLTTLEDTELEYMEVLNNDSDIDGDSLVIQAFDSSSENGGKITSNGDGTLNYLPPANFNGTDSFIYKVADGRGGVAEGTVTIVVDPVNDPPVVVDDSITAHEDTIKENISVLANDSDVEGDTIVISAVDDTSQQGGTIVKHTDGTLSYTPPQDFFGTDTFTYTVEDSKGLSATATVTINVANVNDVPVAADNSASTNEDTVLVTENVLTNDTDIDGDTLSVSAYDSTSAQGGIVAYNGDGTFNYTPPENYNGSDSFTYTVSDGNSGTSQGLISIAVSAVNDPPIVTDDVDTTVEDIALATVNVLANDMDLEGDELLISSADTTSVSGGQVTNKGDGTFTYEPPTGHTGPDSFDYTVSDGLSETQGTVTIYIEPEETKIAPHLAQAGELYGNVGISGNFLIISSPHYNNGTGRVLLYEKDAEQGKWNYSQELKAQDSAEQHYFGWTIAIDGDTLVVGAPNSPAPTESSFPTKGWVYVFERIESSGAWLQKQKLTPSDALAYDEFGYSVDVDGDTIVIGAPAQIHQQLGNPNPPSGSAYIFVKNPDTELWEQQKKLATTDAANGDQVGISVAVAGDTVVIGAPNKNLAKGAAYVFKRESGTSNWTQQDKLTGSDTLSGSGFGLSVTIDNDTAVIASLLTSGVYAFERDPDTGSWSEHQKITDTSSSLWTNLVSTPVKMDGNVLVVGADDAYGYYPFDGGPGAAFIFTRDPGTKNWSLYGILKGPNTTDPTAFGRFLAIDQDTIIGGDIFDGDQAENAGAIYIYRKPGVLK